jgi:hypothetical protein
MREILMIVPGFAPKRIYLENVADRSKAKTKADTNTSSQPQKGFLGLKWGFDGDSKK